RRIDRDQHDVAARRARRPAEARVGQRVVQPRVQAAEQRRCQDAQDQEMRSISSHGRPPGAADLTFPLSLPQIRLGTSNPKSRTRINSLASVLCASDVRTEYAAK